MAVPKRKLSKRRSRTRAAHHALPGPTLVPCPRCSHSRPSHRVCPNCGHYREREVVAKED
jgi:large subunit ribosomal protein L32